MDRTSIVWMDRPVGRERKGEWVEGVTAGTGRKRIRDRIRMWEYTGDHAVERRGVSVSRTGHDIT